MTQNNEVEKVLALRTNVLRVISTRVLRKTIITRITKMFMMQIGYLLSQISIFMLFYNSYNRSF